ncbi:MAG: hypothetical protein O3C25_02925 [Chloroflexi bacterium]|nr:hypothetical protein [Chloroflexota bacterium]
MTARTLLFVGILLAAVGLSGCAAIAPSDDESAAARAGESTATASPAATAATPPPDSAASPSATPSIAAEDFCRVAELTVVDWELPPTLSDGLQQGRITLRYRIPPGAESVLLWLGVVVEPRSVTVGEIVAADPALTALFPAADPATVVPAAIPSDGFDIEADGVVRTIDVGVLLLTEAQFDGSAPWRWSRFTAPPFEVGPPIVSARFRASGIRIDMDGASCSPRFIPLP